MNDRTRILVIDDDPLFRNLIVSVLRKEYLVSVASEGAEGFYKALESPPDVAIVDIQMPGWDGLKTLKAFRSHRTLQHVKILILTSDASRETVLAAVQGGANDYVIKTNFSRDELFAKLETLCAQIAQSGRPRPVGIKQAARPTVPRTTQQAPASQAQPIRDKVERPKPASESPEPSTVDDESLLQELLDAWE